MDQSPATPLLEAVWSEGLLELTCRATQLRSHEAAQQLRTEAMAAIEDAPAAGSPPQGLLIDLGQVGSVGSIALLALLGMRRQLPAVPIVLCGLQPAVHELLETSALIPSPHRRQAAFEVAQSLEEGRRQLKP